ncbi:hypothetical protein [Adhaeribacter arboris]|uniref:hypothetical protein n=1 Tax=Adhaeribacter arboris TaxID=2072846 RepID=UPI001304B489|nr:hypothetical protein [Adhaeribacter arboris]
MELKDYPILQEEEYDAMAHRLNLLAEALENVNPGANVPKSKELKQAAREVLYFFRQLI